MGSQQCGSCEPSTCPSSPYGDFSLTLQNNTQLAVIQKTLPLTAIDPSSLHRQLVKRSLIQCPNITRLHDFSIEVTPFMISLHLSYEYLPLTLKQRRQLWEDRPVSEGEIGNLLLGVENALLELHAKGIRHRMVSLDTILCQKALYKLADNSMVTFLTGLDLARQGDRNQLLSEKNLIVLNNEGTKPDYQLEDDLFSLGLVALLLVLKCEPEGLYLRSYGKTSLNQLRIATGIRILESNYSPWVAKKVREFLNGGLKSSTATNQGTPCKPSLSLSPN